MGKGLKKSREEVKEKRDPLLEDYMRSRLRLLSNQGSLCQNIWSSKWRENGHKGICVILDSNTIL